jgi:hypothetical protein
LEAVRAAQFEDVGGLQASEDLDAALRHALHVESRPIGLHTEIVAVARQRDGVDVEALSRHLEAGTARRLIFDDLRTWKPSASRAARTSSFGTEPARTTRALTSGGTRMPTENGTARSCPMNRRSMASC